MDIVKLEPIKETTQDFERLEARLLKYYRDFLYLPLLKELGLTRKTVQNAIEDLLFAIQSGELTYSNGVFRGKFNSKLSSELRAYGAKWDKKIQAYRIHAQNLPVPIRAAISVSDMRFQEKLRKIDEKLAQILPVEGPHTADLFSSVLFKTDRSLQRTLKNITVSPELTSDAREKIAQDWQTNMDLWVNDFTKKEIERLRKDIEKVVFSGERRKTLVDAIKRSYEVTQNKAKFLARQETGLLMAKFKETRYTQAGVLEYEWRCVAGSANHPVRASHKALEGKIFTWNNPPITTMPGEAQRRNNPGQDYNCRCFAKPIVRFN